LDKHVHVVRSIVYCNHPDYVDDDVTVQTVELRLPNEVYASVTLI